MTNLETLISGAITTYKDARAAYADKHLSPGEIMKLLMDGMVGLQIDWSLIDSDYLALGTDGVYGLLKSAEQQLEDDPLAKKITAVLGAILSLGGIAQ